MRLFIVLPETVIYLIPQLFLAYTLMYGVVTRLVLPGKLVWAMVVTVLLLLATALFSAWLSLTLVDWTRYALIARVSPMVARAPHTPVSISLGVAMLAGLRGAVTVGGIAAAIKLMKKLYEKQQAALQLEKEKIHAELHLLRAQLHPHFLFNTLNNIYSLTQHTSITGSDMIMRLSALLRYMLYEGGKNRVPLDRELKMINDYLQLEALRYGERLELSIDVPTVAPVDIAPLLLLPFVENAFKHGASQVIEKPWINLRLSLADRNLSFVIVNGRDSQSISPEPGIGIANVRQRLALLYPQRHSLEINVEEELYYVHLTLAL